MGDKVEKVVITKQKIIDIADAVRAKTKTTEKLNLSDIPGKISAISVGAETGAPTIYTVTLEPCGENQNYYVMCDDQKKTATFEAEKGSIISFSMEPDEGYRAGIITVTGGKKFSDGTYSLISDMSASVTNATRIAAGKELGAGFGYAGADGVIEGWPLFKIQKALPNNTKIHFVATLECPDDIVIDLAHSGFGVSDFAAGRSWECTNAYANITDPSYTKTDKGTTYLLEWDEKVNITSYDPGDDDEKNGLVGYYCCCYIELIHGSGGTTPFTQAKLSVSAQQ